jgi:uncharacterized protein (DUF362 family)
MARRTFLRGLSAGAALAGIGPLGLAGAAQAAGLASSARAGAAYQVGVGSSGDPYTATMRAIAACGQWPWQAAGSLSGKIVVIKPNLVYPQLATTGVTTDPQVVRAIVDLVLQAGASQVKIVELGALGVATFFGQCGYTTVFTSAQYPQVQLIDLNAAPNTFGWATVTRGMAYQHLSVPSLMLDPNVVLISAAKLKCHAQGGATLAMKNLYGFAQPSIYHVPTQLARMDLHYRGVYQAVVDMNLALPAQFAVVDGIWGLQGLGPGTLGVPIQMNVVLAGVNPLAVDWTCVRQVMGLNDLTVPYLYYAAAKGMGPASPSQITVLGDAFTPASFIPAPIPPVVGYPTATPFSISLGAGQQTAITYHLFDTSSTRVEIIHDDDMTPGITVVRTLRDWAIRAAGWETLVWNGRDDTGAPVAPGLYHARVQARYTPQAFPSPNYATGFVQVTA